MSDGHLTQRGHCNRARMIAAQKAKQMTNSEPELPPRTVTIKASVGIVGAEWDAEIEVPGHISDGEVVSYVWDWICSDLVCVDAWVVSDDD